jgi:hypothetical protein
VRSAAGSVPDGVSQLHCRLQSVKENDLRERKKNSIESFVFGT